MRAALRLSALWERLKGSLWVLPTGFAALALVGGTALSYWRPQSDTAIWELVTFGGTASTAREILVMIAGAMVTITGLTFTLTVVALQMASAQFSPRVLREFLTDRGNQLVLSAFVGTFAYCVAVIRRIRDAEAPGGMFVPEVAVTLGVALTFVAVGALVYFIHHLTRQVRAEAIMQAIVDESLRTIDKVFPDSAGSGRGGLALPEPPVSVRRVPAQRSGYLQAIQVEGLVRAAEAREMIVRVRPPVGAWVVQGTTLAWVWRADGADVDGQGGDTLDRVAHDHVHIGPERTSQQDVAFGFRQLVDIAARALSPGVNDPTTAIDALGNMTVLLARLATREVGTLVAHDAGGEVRAVVPRPGFADYLFLACEQPRRFGAAQSAVLLALMGLLVDLAEVAEREEDRTSIDVQCARTLEIAARELDATELATVRSAAGRVRETLAGGRRAQPEVDAR